MKNKRLLSFVMAITMFSGLFCSKSVCISENVKKTKKDCKTTGTAIGGFVLGAAIPGIVTLAFLLSNTRTHKNKNINYDKIIHNLDDNILWKMVIDRRYHSKGANICDKGGKITDNLKASSEPGYLKSMLTAFNYMVSTINKRKLNSDLFKEFHKKALSDVKIKSQRDRINYRHDPNVNCFFSLVDTNSNEKGKMELSKKQKYGWLCERMLTSKIKNSNGEKLYGNSFSSIDEAENFVKSVFDTYYQKLNELDKNGKVVGSWINESRSKEDKKLEIIIRICQCLDQAHTFYDGNIRTIVFLVMNKMLVENGLSPVCMWDPNYIDMIDIETLIEEVKVSQSEFNSIFVK